MAENKKSVIVYADWIHTFETLSDEEAGMLIKHFFRYVNDQNPSTDDKLIKIAFEPIKQQLKRDLVKWDSIRTDRSKAGKISAELRANKKKQDSTNPTLVDFVKQDPTNPTVNVTVNVTDTVNGTVNEKKKTKRIADKSAAEIKNSALVIDQFPITTAETKKQIAAIEQKNTLYKDCLAEYNNFCKEQIGVKADIDGLQGKSMKGIIAYLRDNVTDKSDQAVLNSWEFILNNFHKWDTFHKDQKKLNQIRSNMLNILNSIKNGKSTSKTKSNQSITEILADGGID